ncbi:MAG: 4-alpha-glucanotransferase [Phycisphaerales bacterium]
MATAHRSSSHSNRPAPAGGRIVDAARAAGIEPAYTDGLGHRRSVPLDALDSLTRCIASHAGPAADNRDNRVILARAGSRAVRIPIAGRVRRPVLRATLSLESTGETLCARTQYSPGELRVLLPVPVPVGTHTLTIEFGGDVRSYFVLAPPATLAAPPLTSGGRLAVFLPLHAVRSRRGLGVGTFADLRELSEWAHSCGADLLGTLPLFPAFLDRPFDPSPYAPVSRLFWGEHFVDPAGAPESRAPAVRVLTSSAEFRRRAAEARRGRWVDYDATWSLQRRLLLEMSRVARAHASRWRQVLSDAGPLAGDYAAFRAALDPAANRRDRAESASMYIYAQSLANSEIAALATSATGARPLYLDLPVGVHPDGYDVARHPHLFLHGVSAGAPPDPLYAAGQVWGFPPLHPTAGRADGYAYLRAVLRRMLGVAGVLRIDHVMGLVRMYCVPPGFDGAQGAYLHYPADELFAVVMIEAARAGALIVGEDLGTVPDRVRHMMQRRGILGMQVQQFALSGSPRPITLPASPLLLASLNTHDTPTFAGFWHADDVSLRHRLGAIDRATAVRERRDRAAMRDRVRRDLARRRLPARAAASVATSLMTLQARSHASISLVNLEDLLLERAPQNVPGTTTQYPNWRRRAAATLEQFVGSPVISRRLRRLAAERTASSSKKAPRR